MRKFASEIEGIENEITVLSESKQQSWIGLTKRLFLLMRKFIQINGEHLNWESIYKFIYFRYMYI
ncbi:hypothetical protein C1I59_11030 [Paenibacillus polymyxa]|nr:hypothetical protein A9Z39_21930 [Paenibacillus polymyxa]TKH36943.1 hypothetical protein C1I59_11030 [Paenibacillus polymyxa]